MDIRLIRTPAAMLFVPVHAPWAPIALRDYMPGDRPSHIAR